MGLKALKNKVIIIPDAPEETTESGIIIEGKLKANSFGEIVAVGDGVTQVSVHDRVVYSPTHYDEIEHQKTVYHVLEERDIYAIIE